MPWVGYRSLKEREGWVACAVFAVFDSFVIGDVAGVNIRIFNEQVGERVGLPDMP
jgi:hypothetical protein